MTIIPRITRTRTVDLSEEELTELWRFYSRFTTRSREALIDFVAQMTYVYRVRSSGGELVGGTAFREIEGEIEGRSYTVLWASLVAIDNGYRRYLLSELITLHARFSLGWRHRSRQIFGASAVSSPKAYRVFRRFFAESWPRPDKPTPPYVQAVMEHAARQALPADAYWDKHTWVAGLKRKETWAAATAHGHAENPDERFFEERCPGYRSGDALLVLGRAKGLKPWLHFFRNTARRVVGTRRKRGALRR